MDDGPARGDASRPPRRSSAAEVGGANVGPQDHGDDLFEVHATGDAPVGPDRQSPAAGRRERSNSATELYQRYMPMGLLKFPIPRKPKEKRALFQFIATESREYDDMMTILTSSYIDTSSAGCFIYSKPRLVHSELLEKEFVEKRKEMKADGRTDKELEQSYCFLLADSVKLPLLCEKGLFTGQSRVTVLGNPAKGVYLSRYSDLIHTPPLTPGVTGDIVIFKVMKGKVKSIYENMKNLLDPTPRFDSHTAKNASKVTSLASYRAFELTQQYFYEYSFDELRPRPRQVCPYAVVSFQFKGKDSSLPCKPLAPIRLNSQSAEGSKECAQFPVWTGDLVKGDRLLFQVSLCSFSPPLLPHRLPEKLEIGLLMRLEQATKLLPADLFCYDLYSGGHEVVRSGHCCSLLEVTDRSRSASSVTSLLQELEMNRVVLVTPLSDRGFLLLLSSVQMATPSERGESWKRCLQALFVFPQSRHLAKSKLRRSSLTHDASGPVSGVAVMPRLSQLIPALHHALVKARANPPPELSAGVERQARDYLIGMNQGTVQQYPMGEFDSKLDERGNLFPTPKHHQVNMEGYLRSYLYSPALYQLSVARAKQMVQAHCGPEELPEATLRKTCGGQREAAAEETISSTRNKPTKHEKMQQLVDLVLTCKRDAENEVKREEGAGAKVPGRKRKLEQVTAERALKFLKASQEPSGRVGKIPGEGSHAPYSTASLTSVIGLLGLKDLDLREDGSEAAVRLHGLLTDLNQAARGTTKRSVGEVREEGQRESSPLDRLATKLGLPPNCDIDLRKQQELEEQTAGSVSSLEGFSPSSHSGEMNHHGGAGREGGGGLERRAGAYEKEEDHIQWEIPWVLIPITGVCSQRYTHRDRNIPQDPRFQHLTTATSGTTTTKPRGRSPARSPERSSPPSPLKFPSPEPSPLHSPYQCPSPDPSPPPSPSQCPSPETSLPPSPSPCPSPEPSPPPSPRPSLSASPSRGQALPLGCPPFPARGQSAEPNELVPFNEAHSGANEEQSAPTAWGFAGLPKDVEEEPWGKEKKSDEPLVSVSIQPSIPLPPERRTSPFPPPTERVKGDAERETIPGLLSLKRRASVAFVGINDLDDIRNNCCDELFVSGGCVVSDEFVLNPDFITRDQLVALLVVLEQHSSPQSAWTWKVHWQTHKKLNEQARFRRDAADLLEVLSAYQKRQIVELLPYHHCDKINHQSPHLECLMELQAQHKQYRHTVFLTVHHFEMFPGHSRSGIIVASINEILHNFTGLVGYHDIKDRQPIIDDMLGSKGLGRHRTSSASVSGFERSSSVFPEHIRPFPSCDQPQHVALQGGSIPPALPHWSDQLVPDASSKEVLQQHSDTDFEVLRLAISQLRAERNAQLQQQLDARAESYINSFTNLLPNVCGGGGGGGRHSTPLLAQGGPTESEMVSQDKKAVSVTLEMIHSALQQEQVEDEATKGGALTQTVGRRCGGRAEGGGHAGYPIDGTPVRVGGNRDPGNCTSLSNQSTAAATRPSTQAGSASDGMEKKNRPGEPVLPKAAQYAAASHSTTAGPAEGHRSNTLRETQLGQEQPIGGEGAAPGNSTASGTKTQPDLTNNKGEAGNRGNRLTAPRPSAKSCTQRLQLYNRKGRKFQSRYLWNSNAWKDISYARPGWTPDQQPFLKPGNQYLELKANSTVVFIGTAPPKERGPNQVACGVTCYNHEEGPWCEVQSKNGTRLCILGVPLTTVQTSSDDRRRRMQEKR
uniref:protein TASOR isoform X4 n=1 Tax=Gasterosteus aculeatus aculeatus TaxID=481459 RepID=UPI001A989EEE|nr:protein TASOR isoform X4 [Gasterosteus aculeatus aculeatus]